jgi:hypothetical protein
MDRADGRVRQTFTDRHQLPVMDGSPDRMTASDLEQAIDDIIDCSDGRVQVILPRNGCRAATPLSTRASGRRRTIDLRWRVLPDDGQQHGIWPERLQGKGLPMVV